MRQLHFLSLSRGPCGAWEELPEGKTPPNYKNSGRPASRDSLLYHASCSHQLFAHCN
jgi:hypothetical protein